MSYTVADDAGNQSSAFVEVRIVPPDEVNRPPIARTDIARTRSGVAVIVEAVANDSDPDGDIIAVESIRTQPTGGTAAVEDGDVVYTPSDTFVGTDRFTYSLVDAGGEIAVGEVLIGVMPAAGANRAPEAFDDSVQAIAGAAPLVFDVLANDSDPDGDVAARDDGRHAVARRDGRRRRTVTASRSPRRRSSPPARRRTPRSRTPSTTVVAARRRRPSSVKVLTASAALAPIGRRRSRRPARPRAVDDGRRARATTSTSTETRRSSS